MSEEKNDMHSDGEEKKLPLSLDKQLRTLIHEKELSHFRNELPDAFLNDASEGLDQVADDSQLDGILSKMNHQMRQQLLRKKKKTGRRTIGEFSWSYWAIIIILLLCICAFLVIRLMLHHN